MFSKNKEQFLESKDLEQKTPYQLKPLDLPKIAAHYQHKFGIKIIVSGQTSYGQTIIQELKKGIRLTHQGSLPYLHYLEQHLGRAPRYHDHDFQKRHRLSRFDSHLHDYSDDLEQSLDKFLDPESNIGSGAQVKSLTPSEAHAFDDICRQFPFVKDLNIAIKEWNAMKYVRYLIKNDLLKHDRSKIYSYFTEEKTMQALSKFLVIEEIDGKPTPVRVKRYLPIKSIKKLNKLCSQLPFVIQFDEAIQESEKDTLKDNIANCRLSSEQSIEEIRFIQSNLTKGDAVGYLYMSGKDAAEDHVEALIITPTQLVNLNSFPLKTIRTDDMYLPQLHLLAKRISNNSNFILEDKLLHTPQAGVYECGTLGSLHLKELLKNNAQQLQDFTLTFSCYLDNQLIHLFVPSPHVLRYSQVSTYNIVTAAMLRCQDDALIVTAGKNSYTTNTLQKILKDSIKTATQKDDKETAQSNQMLLDHLPSFSKRWLDAYDKAEKQRGLMQGEHNYYLFYRTLKMQKIVERTEPAAGEQAKVERK